MRTNFFIRGGGFDFRRDDISEMQHPCFQRRRKRDQNERRAKFRARYDTEMRLPLFRGLALGSRPRTQNESITRRYGYANSFRQTAFSTQGDRSEGS